MLGAMARQDRARGCIWWTVARTRLETIWPSGWRCPLLSLLTLGPGQGPPTSVCPPRTAPPDRDPGVCPPQHVYLEWMPSELGAAIQQHRKKKGRGAGGTSIGGRKRRGQREGKRVWEEEAEKDGLEEENGIKRIQMEERKTGPQTHTHIHKHTKTQKQRSRETKVH